jgi:hypothetical protein
MDRIEIEIGQINRYRRKELPNLWIARVNVHRYVITKIWEGIIACCRICDLPERHMRVVCGNVYLSCQIGAGERGQRITNGWIYGRCARLSAALRCLSRRIQVAFRCDFLVSCADREARRANEGEESQSTERTACRAIRRQALAMKAEKPE